MTPTEDWGNQLKIMSDLLVDKATEISAEVRVAIQETDAAFMEAFNRGDAGGAAKATYTRDAQIQPPGAPLIEGREGHQKREETAWTSREREHTRQIFRHGIGLPSCTGDAPSA